MFAVGLGFWAPHFSGQRFWRDLTEGGGPAPGFPQDPQDWPQTRGCLEPVGESQSRARAWGQGHPRSPRAEEQPFTKITQGLSELRA